MVFRYKLVTVSGTQEGVEGVSAGINEITTYLQEVGWNLVDDRRSQAASNDISLTHKVVFSSNGEEDNYPTFFLTLVSGTSTATDQNAVTFLAHTAYDLTAHDVPASGVSSGPNNKPSAVERLQIRSQDDDTEIYMSGDSEMVHFITRRVNLNNISSTMDNVMVGRFNSFMSIEDNPYPLIANGSTGITITTAEFSEVRGTGGNPPEAFDASGSMEVRNYVINTAQQPYNIGAADTVFNALPLLVSYNSASIGKGIAGTIRNAWALPANVGVLNLGNLIASGTFGIQEYLSFTVEPNSSGDPLVVRKS